MISILILIACTTAVFGAPTQLTVSEEMELIFQNLTSEAQEDYFQILFNGELTLAEMDEKFDKWAEKHGISDKWMAYTEKWLARREKFDKTVLTVIENLPSAYKMMKEITSNRNQTIQEAQGALEKLEEPYHLEVTLVALLSKIMMQNEEAVMNGGNIEVGNEVYRRMRDFPKNGNFKALLLPGPF